MYGFRFGRVGFTVAFLMAGQAMALDVDFTAPIMDLEGEPLIECADKVNEIKPGEACKAFKPVTLGTIASRAMCAGEQNVPADEIFKRCSLGVQTAKSSAVELSPEEKASFRKQISRVYGPQSGLIVMRAVTLIDPTPPK